MPTCLSLIRTITIYATADVFDALRALETAFMRSDKSQIEMIADDGGKTSACIRAQR